MWHCSAVCVTDTNFASSLLSPKPNFSAVAVDCIDTVIYMYTYLYWLCFAMIRIPIPTPGSVNFETAHSHWPVSVSTVRACRD